MFKKIIALLICSIMATSLFMTASADIIVPADQTVITEDWGTYEDGLKPGKPPHDYYRYQIPYTETDGFPNADFEQGLKYWTHCRGRIPSESVKLVKDGENTAIQFTAKEEYDGIFSVPFTDSRVKQGDNLVVVYSWKGTGHIQIGLEQIMKNQNEPDCYVKVFRVSHIGITGQTKSLYLSADGSKWNVSMSNLNLPIAEPEGTDKNIYLSLFAQICNDMTDETIVDNLIIARYNEQSGLVFDLDGNKLYDLNNLPVDDVEDELNKDDFSSIDYDATPEDIKEKRESKENTTEEKTFFQEHLVLIIVLGAIIIAGAAVAAIIIIKKSKSKTES